jgi:hypothetical protein
MCVETSRNQPTQGSMTMTFKFNFSEIDPNAPKELLPDGTYDFEITTVKPKISKGGNLTLMTVNKPLDKRYAKLAVFHYVTFAAPNEDTGATGNLDIVAAYFDAIGVTPPDFAYDPNAEDAKQRLLEYGADLAERMVGRVLTSDVITNAATSEYQASNGLKKIRKFEGTNKPQLADADLPF